MIVIIPCGAKKRVGRWAARDLYTGPYFRGCLRYAMMLTSPPRVFILSAKYGLLGLDDPVASYDLRMGQQGSVSVREVRRQAAERDLVNTERVIVLGGKRYAEVCRGVWPACETPLRGVGGIGKQLAWLKKHESLP